MSEPRNDALWEQKCPPDVFHIENALSYVFAYILNHSTGSINAISAHIYLFKVTPETLKKGCETCSKLTIKTPERRQWRLSGLSIANFEHISQHFL